MSQTFSVHTLPSWEEIQVKLKQLIPLYPTPSHPTQASLARYLGVNRSTVSRMMRSDAKVTYDNAVKTLQWLELKGHPML